MQKPPLIVADTKASLWLLNAHLQAAVEKVCGCAIGREPVAMQQEVVYFVGKDKLLEFDAALAQPRHKIHRLREVHVPVVVPVNE